MNAGKLLLIGRVDQVGDSFKTFVDRKIRERRRDERRLGEHRTTKHQLQARKSCVADARSYRVASHGFKRWLTAIKDSRSSLAPNDRRSVKAILRASWGGQISLMR